MTFASSDYDKLLSLLLSDRSRERGAYMRCGLAESPEESRLLVRDVLSIEPEDVLQADRTHMRIASRSFMRVLKSCDRERTSFAFVHSHPVEQERHSLQDDDEELKLFRTAHLRIERPRIHASLVLSDPSKPVGRVWLADGTWRPISRIRVIGDRFRFFDDVNDAAAIPEFFDRQVRAFGNDLQSLLGRLSVGVVGAGGTGSAVMEQLIRLGVGTIIVADGQRFEKSNVNRVYGSSVRDEGLEKTAIVERLVGHIALPTNVVTIGRPVTFRSAMERFRQCDVIFGCTDDEWGRSLLTKLALYYLIPVFDLGVRIDADDGVIRSVQGRVTTLVPGAACLYCRGRITARRVYVESLLAVAPAEAEGLRKEGYIPDLDQPNPAVIPFTTTVAAGAVGELVHRLTGYMGGDRKSTEVIYRFDVGDMRTNARPPEPDCWCADKDGWGRGDRSPLLDVTWRLES